MKNSFVKMVLGLVILLFSAALAYFSANYVDATRGSNYWLALAMFGGAYVLIGIVTAMIFPISLGFLLSADIIILDLLFEQYSKVDEVYKALLVAFVLFVLYVFTWLNLGDQPAEFVMPAQSPIVPPQV